MAVVTDRRTRGGSRRRYPGRQVVPIVGDGGFTMLMGEVATLVKHKLLVKVIVFKNNVLDMIKWEQMVLEGTPQYGVELEPNRLRRLRARVRRRRLHGHGSERPALRTPAGLRPSRTGRRRGRRRSERAAAAGQDHDAVGGALRRSPAQAFDPLAADVRDKRVEIVLGAIAKRRVQSMAQRGATRYYLTIGGRQLQTSQSAYDAAPDAGRRLCGRSRERRRSIRRRSGIDPRGV
jgi:hypothetical protein